MTSESTPDAAAAKASAASPSAEKAAVGSQFLRYLVVGVFNTLFGYGMYVVALSLLSHALPARYLYLTVILASVLSTPLNITVAYFGYKFFVFRTRGNYLREWLKAFAVYGTSMLIGLLALSALTRMTQGLLQRHAGTVQSVAEAMAQHLPAAAAAWPLHLAVNRALPGYIAGAVVTALSTIYSFIGHRNFTFRAKPAAA